MKQNRRCIRLSPDENNLLRTLHKQSGVPDGQFPQRPSFWREFTDTWNEATGRNDSPEELLHYIVTQRKQAKWFRFDGDYERLATPSFDLLSDEEWKVVETIYVDMGHAADNFLYDGELRSELLARFIQRTGRHIPDLVFSAALIARRKRGWLPKTESRDHNSIGFSDLDDVATA